MKMHMPMVCALISIGLCAQAFGMDVEFQSDRDPPIRFHHAAPTLIVHRGLKPITFGYGNTPLDSPRTFTCGSASGCLVTAKTSAGFNQSTCPVVSAFLDGVAMNPPTVDLCETQSIAQQSAIVSMGKHTIQCEVMEPVQGYQGATTGFEAEYEINTVK